MWKIVSIFGLMSLEIEIIEEIFGVKGLTRNCRQLII
jgi:hypothetical protein